MNQYQIEQYLKITEEEAEWLNANKSHPVRESVVSLLTTQCSTYDTAGFAMLEMAVSEMRQVRSDWELVIAYLHHNGTMKNFFSYAQKELLRSLGDGFGYINNPDSYQLWEWAHIRDSSPEAIKDIAAEIRRILHGSTP